MALVKQGYSAASRGTAYGIVKLNSSGFIAVDDDEVATTKTVQVNLANADNTQADNQLLLSTLFGFVPNAKDVTNDRMRVIWEV